MTSSIMGRLDVEHYAIFISTNQLLIFGRLDVEHYAIFISTNQLLIFPSFSLC